MIQLAITAFNNKNLFSNYYLDKQIKNIHEWKKDEHKIAFSEMKKLYDTEKDFLPTLNEKQLEQRFFGPIFKILNHTVEVNEGTESQEFPDYAFFTDRNSLDDAHKNKGMISFYNNAFAIGEVKRWGIELDRFGRDEKDRKRNPSLQIWIYLHDVSPKWGILSNGKIWRLYCKDRRRDDYYEIDLPSLLAKDESKNVEEFKYFYYFFRKDAFQPSKEGKTFLDDVLKGSADYAKDIGDDLKDNVYKAMKKVAEGFFSWSQNGLDIQSEAARETVQKCTMLLLYRFLFLLYAEGKGLLDLKKPQYQSYSFYKLKNEVKEKQNGSLEQKYLGVGTTLWSRLRDTFRLINQGSESFGIDKNVLNVPAYNGGLFDPQKNPELEKWVIGDTYLSEAIDLLSRSIADGGKLDFVDYSTLEIRHLGSIYEGLLEYKLRVANEEMVVNGGEWIKLEDFNKDRKQKKVFLDFDEFDRVKKDQLYLATDKGERKATGSYYTPDYIVNYIVKNTIGPVVDEKWTEAETNKKSFVDITLSVKVLDPAMGSGHFLVGSIEFLSEKLLLAVKKDIDHGRFSDESHLTSDWARREVVSHCIYGVDLNPMAVELAKVGLWLTTISKMKPLSFLDHRLKQGNSLIGARLSDLKSYPAAKKKDKDQTTLPSFISPLFITHLIGKIAELEKIKDERLEDIKRKEKVFAEFKQLPEYRKAKALANIYTGVYFGNEVKPTENKDSANVYYDLIWAIMGDENEWRRKTNRDWFTKANQIAQEKSFFHWELEFPELFFEGGAPKENPGWDAVVGNPPYVRIQATDESDKSYISRVYGTAIGNYDLYVPFVEKSISLFNRNGHFCFIMPNKFINVDYGEGLRLNSARDKLIDCILNFGDNQIFHPQTTYTCLFFLSKKGNEFFQYYEVQPLLDVNNELPAILSDIETSPKIYNLNIIISELDSKSWHFFAGPAGDIFKRMDKIPLKLDDIIDRDFQGVATSDDPVYILEICEESSHLLKVFSQSLGKEIEVERDSVKPLFKGSEIARYSIAQYRFCLLHPYSIGKNGHYLIPPEEYEYRWPKAWNYLKENEQRLRKRERGKMDQKEWYAYVYPKNLDQFERPKIMTQVLSKYPVFSYDSEGKYFFVGGGTAGGHGMTLKDSYGLSSMYILCLLNCKLLDIFFDKISTRFRGGYRAYTKGFTGKLPIRRISFTTPPDQRAALYAEAKALFSEYLGAQESKEIDRINRIDRINASNPVNPVHPVHTAASFSGAPDSQKILEFIATRMSAAPEESDVVHDLLAYLAERMIEMNKEKNAEIKGFLNWLEGEIGAPIEELTNKTAIKEYYEAGFDALAGVLAKNKKKLKEGYDPTRREPKEKLQTEFNASAAKLAPLLRRIEATDGLIDRIVYNLYGLKEDEIKIVEGSISGEKHTEEPKS